MDKTLKLECRGCNFGDNDTSVTGSDVGNYRVGVYEYAIKGKDGREYLIEFSRGYRYETRTTNKRTGAPLKKPITSCVSEIQLHIDTQYEAPYYKNTNQTPIDPDNEFIATFRNRKLEEELWKMNLRYTKADILRAVNYISADHYTDIEIA